MNSLTGTFVPGTTAPSLPLDQTLGGDITPTEQDHFDLSQLESTLTCQENLIYAKVERTVQINPQVGITQLPPLATHGQSRFFQTPVASPAQQVTYADCRHPVISSVTTLACTFQKYFFL